MEVSRPGTDENALTGFRTTTFSTVRNMERVLLFPGFYALQDSSQRTAGLGARGVSPLEIGARIQSEQRPRRRLFDEFAGVFERFADSIERLRIAVCGCRAQRTGA